MGIFDWNTPPPTTSMNSIMKENNLDLSGWISPTNFNTTYKIKNKTTISRRHTLNQSNWRNGNRRQEAPLRRAKSSNNDRLPTAPENDTKLESGSYESLPNNHSRSGLFSPHEYYRNYQVPINGAQTHPQEYVAYTTMHRIPRNVNGSPFIHSNEREGGMPMQYTSIQQFDGNPKTIYLKNYQYNNVNIMYPNMNINPSDTQSMPSNVGNQNQRGSHKLQSQQSQQSSPKHVQNELEMQNVQPIPRYGTGAGASMVATADSSPHRDEDESDTEPSPLRHSIINDGDENSEEKEYYPMRNDSPFFWEIIFCNKRRDTFKTNNSNIIYWNIYST